MRPKFLVRTGTVTVVAVTMLANTAPHVTAAEVRQTIGPGATDCEQQYCYLKAIHPTGTVGSVLAHFAPSLLPVDEREAFERECLPDKCIVTLTATRRLATDDIVTPLHATWRVVK